MLRCVYTDTCYFCANNSMLWPFLALHILSPFYLCSQGPAMTCRRPLLQKRIVEFACKPGPGQLGQKPGCPQYCALCCPLQEYFLNTSAWADINPRQMLGPAVCIKEFDLLTVSQQEIAAPVEVRQLFCWLDRRVKLGLIKEMEQHRSSKLEAIVLEGSSGWHAGLCPAGRLPRPVHCLVPPAAALGTGV